MGRIQTDDFARILLGGIGQGAGMFNNAAGLAQASNALRQRERQFDANMVMDQQRLDLGRDQLDSQNQSRQFDDMLRLMQLTNNQEEAARQQQEEEVSRTMMADMNLQRLGAVGDGLSPIAGLTADRVRKLPLRSQMMLMTELDKGKTAKELRDRANKLGGLVPMVKDPDQRAMLQAFVDTASDENDVGAVRSMLSGAFTAQQRQIEAQRQAEAKIAQQQAAQQRYRESATRAGVPATEVDMRIAADEAGVGYERPARDMDPKVLLDADVKRLDAEIERIERDLLNAGVLRVDKDTKAVKVDAKALNKGAAVRSDGRGASPEYTQRQRLWTQYQLLRQQREAIGVKRLRAAGATPEQIRAAIQQARAAQRGTR